MARSSWESLSPAYRSRLERGGITRQDYLSGASLSGARGHKATPERPERADRNPERYKEYLATRKRLEKAVQVKKQGEFGDSHKFRINRSNTNVAKNPVTGMEVPMADLRKAANADSSEWLEWLQDDRERWGFLFYH